MIGGASGWQLTESGPEAYERHLVPAIFAPFAERLLELAAPRPGGRVLDVACGTGIVARRSSQWVGSSGTVAGVDSNGRMLDVARASSAGIEPPIRWLEADASDLPLPDESVDCVLCQQGLQFVADRVAALREMARVLAPGGCLALSVWRSLEGNPGFAVLMAALERQAGKDVAAILRPPFSGPDHEGLRELIDAVGLRDARIEIHIEAVRFPSAKELLWRQAAASPLGAAVASLSRDVRAALAHDLADALRARTDDQGVVFPMETLNLVAMRP